MLRPDILQQPFGKKQSIHGSVLGLEAKLCFVDPFPAAALLQSLQQDCSE
jgi:hypothetical protein